MLSAGPWAQALGPPFVTGDRSAWLWAGPEAPSRKLSDSAPAELPGRAGQAVKGQKKRKRQAHGDCLSWQRESIADGKGTVQLPFGKPRLQTHRPLPGLLKRFRAFVPVGAGAGYTIAPSTSTLLKARKEKKSTQRLDPPKGGRCG